MYPGKYVKSYVYIHQKKYMFSIEPNKGNNGLKRNNLN